MGILIEKDKKTKKIDLNSLSINQDNCKIFFTKIHNLTHTKEYLNSENANSLLFDSICNKFCNILKEHKNDFGNLTNDGCYCSNILGHPLMILSYWIKSEYNDISDDNNIDINIEILRDISYVVINGKAYDFLSFLNVFDETAILSEYILQDSELSYIDNIVMKNGDIFILNRGCGEYTPFSFSMCFSKPERELNPIKHYSSQNK